MQKADLNIAIPNHGCLVSWAKQGVLLLNTTLSVEEGKDSNLVNVNYARIVELLKEIKEKHYPEVRIDFSTDGSGITLFKSPTPVLKDDPRYALITTDI